LIKSSICEFINSNDSAILSDFELTLKTIEGKPFQLKNGKWIIGRWAIEKVGTQEPIACYFIDYSSESLMFYLYLSKQGGAYKVIDWRDETVS
jgi:hypothetical protein